MNTLLLSGPRLARKASQAPHPPMRERTSCRDLPQNEQLLQGSTGSVLSDVLSFPGEASDLPRDIPGSSLAGSFAESVFQSAKPICRATISRHVLWDSETFRLTRESRRAFAMVLAFF